MVWCGVVGGGFRREEPEGHPRLRRQRARGRAAGHPDADLGGERAAQAPGRSTKLNPQQLPERG